MLILSRKVDEQIKIGDNITITIIEVAAIKSKSESKRRKALKCSAKKCSKRFKKKTKRLLLPTQVRSHRYRNF